MEDLLLKYYNKELDDSEIRKVEDWLKENDTNRKVFDDYVKIWESSASAALFDRIPVEEDWAKVKSKIGGDRSSNSQGRGIHLFFRYAASVALLITLGVAGYMIFTGDNQEVFVAENQQSPEQNQVLLADGSKVILNADSRLIYPNSFEGEARTVELEGEAYFEVAKNPEKPFIIKHGNTQTRVLGTKFNLRAYPQEQQVEVAVTEGKVQLSELKNEKNKVVLTRNNVGVYHRDTKEMVRLNQLDENYLSWRTGVLSFKNSSLLKVVKDLKRHYRIDFVIQDKEKAVQVLVSARFEKQNLDEVLKELSLVLGIEFSQKKNYVLVEN